MPAGRPPEVPEPTGWGSTRTDSSDAPTRPAAAVPERAAPDEAGPAGPAPYTVPDSVQQAGEDADARRRAALIVVAVVAGLVLLAGLVTAAVTRPTPVTTTTTAAPETTTTLATTTTVPPTSIAPATAASTTTTAPPPVPNVAVAVAPPERICSAEPSENTAVLSWSTSEASGVVVSGPAGTISSERNGSRTVSPSMPCEDVPPEGLHDVYSATGRNATGTTQKQATIVWLPAGTVGD